MKFTNIIICLAFLFFLSCNDALELSPPSSISNASFWQTENDARGANAGLYSQFRNTFDSKLQWWGEFRSDYWDWGTSGGAWDWGDFWMNDVTPATSRTNWSNIYILINDANLILKYVPDIAFSNEAEKEFILGSAYFMRAFSYFQLAKIWGDAPIALEGFESAAQELELTRSPVAEIYQQAKDDVEQAVALLPPANPGQEPYFATQAATNMLKADLYLWTAKVAGGGTADLNTANAAVDAVLNAGYALEENYETVFRDESSSEIIFSVFYSLIEAGTAEVANDNKNRTTNGANISAITLHGASFVPEQFRDTVPTQSGLQWLILDERFVNDVLKPADIDARTPVIWQEEELSIGEFVWINKYIGEELNGLLQPTSDIIIYRYAEALLFKAEIENALGNSGEAINQLNRVAQRAYGVDNFYAASLSSEEIDNAILDERIIEFVLEGKSFYDIRRFGQAFTRIPSLVGREGEKNGNILLLPVDQDIINRNPKIKQTEGY